MGPLWNDSTTPSFPMMRTIVRLMTMYSPERLMCVITISLPSNQSMNLGSCSSTRLSRLRTCQRRTAKDRVDKSQTRERQHTCKTATWRMDEERNTRDVPADLILHVSHKYVRKDTVVPVWAVCNSPFQSSMPIFWQYLCNCPSSPPPLTCHVT